VHSVFGHTLTAPRPVEVCLFDGTLYPRAAIAAVGLPRTDYFLMFGDYEYALRLGRAGFELFVGPSIHSLPGYSGRLSSPPWRGYYQTRNHVRTALAARSPVLLYGALDRATRQMLASAFRHEDRAGLRNRLRLLGIWHAFTGQMGRRLEPTDPRYR
jgi:GT2 family glycosyltransferase